MDFKWILPFGLQLVIFGGGLLWSVASIHTEIAVIQNDMRHVWESYSRLERLVGVDKRTLLENIPPEYRTR